MRLFQRKRSYNRWMWQLEMCRSIQMNKAGIAKKGVEKE
jgi:hypothetical protein